ncbi:MAG: hypothetical protein KME45_08925 [Stenomitos rutilans HA7619-LM2]|nr:hypothetical protein [Stenomitos rutilans HA7619-LM2]
MTSRFSSHPGCISCRFTGDGVQEAIVQCKAYESTSFEIYAYKNNQLNRVFQGAGYGC